ncbi:M24 family metallopeptidase [Kaistia dalseonensis]|uniref:Xaa-Pro aminopeptidase n=1 Tax=Kaistia dalseonensis TaxID=410840 RepID=A0ABU0H795_9HYPH|nr:M24 family metallopeptidase [Kaistia dalseonensis]MCX5495582.1 M24 family metallopeptidase [Kaistia dalseonensis]MDQ0438174.1 Xaa-Pro aminopeptidase [Kaistia dalseonensis]
MFSLPAAQSFMKAEGIDGWLLYDYRGSNLFFWSLLGESRAPTRRAFLIVPREGEPVLVLHTVDQMFFIDFKVEKRIYRGWEEMRAIVRELLGNTKRLAVEYSPMGAVPTASFIDAGTVEWLREVGYDLVSSADLFQVSASAWDDFAIDSHQRACVAVAGIKDAAFDLVRSAIRKGGAVSEYEVQSFMVSEFERLGLETEGHPVVQVNGHSGTPHYEPRPESSSPIGLGDWLLIDFWARYPGERNVYSDIAWGAYAGREIPEKLQSVFDIVKHARDAALEAIRSAWARGETLAGWQVDDVARGIIATAGYGDNFHHRTGHSMGPGKRLHALGVNLDNLETHDTRRILPRTGFSIEPAIYLPEFGVRLEINVYLDPVAGPSVTTPIQNEIVLLV